MRPDTLQCRWGEVTPPYLHIQQFRSPHRPSFPTADNIVPHIDQLPASPTSNSRAAGATAAAAATVATVAAAAAFPTYPTSVSVWRDVRDAARSA